MARSFLPLKPMNLKQEKAATECGSKRQAHIKWPTSLFVYPRG